jgi:DNA replication protein DnaC
MTYKNCQDCTEKFSQVRKYLESNIPPDYIYITFSEIEKNFSTNFYKKFYALYNHLEQIISKKGIIFHRLNDTSFGVSTSGIFLLKKMIEIGYDGFYTEINDLINNMFNFGGSDNVNDRRQNVLEYFTNVDCLLIDNFGLETNKKQYESSFVYQKFSSILTNRSLNGRKTILCTDLSKDEFKQMYKGPILNTISRFFYPFEVESKTPLKKRVGEELSEIDPIFKNMEGYNEIKKVIKISTKKSDNTDSDKDSLLDRVIK